MSKSTFKLNHFEKGVKIHEGRVWNSEHRGRLWIHAAAAEPDADIVKSQLSFYNMTPEDFDNWPTSCLLGFCFRVQYFVFFYLNTVQLYPSVCPPTDCPLGKILVKLQLF